MEGDREAETGVGAAVEGTEGREGSKEDRVTASSKEEAKDVNTTKNQNDTVLGRIWRKGDLPRNSKRSAAILPGRIHIQAKEAMTRERGHTCCDQRLAKLAA